MERFDAISYVYMHWRSIPLLHWNMSGAKAASQERSAKLSAAGQWKGFVLSLISDLQLQSKSCNPSDLRQ